jgi:hypothetical protein
MRDVESLYEKAGLPKLSKSTASRICEELGGALRRSSAATCTRSTWRRRSSTRSFCPSAAMGPKEGVLVAWGFTEAGERVLLSVMLGMRSPTRTGLRSGAI